MTPLNDALYRYVMNTRKVHTDDTPVKVLAPGRKKAKTGYIWTYVRDDRNAGSPEPPAVWFAYSPDHQGKHPEQHLRLFRGILQADAFCGYDRLFSAEREGGALTEAGFWAHAWRKIYDVYISSKSATAEEALKLIGELYTIEHEIRGLPVSERLATRQMQSKPLLASLYKLMQEKEHTLSKKCRLGDAFRYIGSTGLRCATSVMMVWRRRIIMPRKERFVQSVSERKTLCSSAAITMASVEHCCMG